MIRTTTSPAVATESIAKADTLVAQEVAVEVEAA